MALLIALSFLASPLIAVVLALVIGVPAVLLLVVRGRAESSGSQARSGSRPVTPEGRTQTPTGRASGEPASGEG